MWSVPRCYKQGTMSPLISTTICLQPQCSWTSKRPLIPHDTLACYISCQNWNWSSSLAPFFHNANSMFRQKAKYPRQGKCEQGCLKVLSCPLLCTCIEMMPPQTPGAYLALSADDACLYATDGKEGFVIRKL
jgi:hypothetical protein